ncbi:MAG: flippase-like domain-containing protein, partial [Gemmatimonadetes bacterium]|nr:flippase-like domain-containing protein [Gemmatimonadota bacterium]
SFAIVASYVVVFTLGARAVGIEASTAILVLTAPPILVAMLIPVSVAGWGLREGAAAALWGFVGLSAADGVAVSVAYGLLVLASSLPGAVFLVTGPGGLRARNRRGGRTRG